MNEETVKKLCEETRKKLDEMQKKDADPKGKELFASGFNLLEAHLVNQARIADSLQSLVKHVKLNL